VEFRSTVSMILDRLEDNRFRNRGVRARQLRQVITSERNPRDGRVACRSNSHYRRSHPHRLRRDSSRECVVSPTRSPEQFEISRLADFVAEQRNPGNEKHVTRIMLQMSSPRLRDGIVFVDTPGLGSLATRGAAETLAYSASLRSRSRSNRRRFDAYAGRSEDCTDALRCRYASKRAAEQGRSAHGADDRAQVIEYVKGHIHSELNLETQVHAVSAIPVGRDLLTQWFENDIAPLYCQRQELKLRSIRRKVGTLQQSVEAALKVRLRPKRENPEIDEEQIRSVEARLRQASGKLQEANSSLRRIGSEIADLGSPALWKAAAALVESWKRGGQEIDAQRVVLDTVNATVQEKSAQLRDILAALGSEVHQSLRSAAEVLKQADMPGDGEFSSFLREMPVLDFGTVTLIVNRPRMAFLLGQGFAKKWTARKLARSVGPHIVRALHAYRQLVEAWGDRMISQIRRRFDAYANGYRAQLERLAGPHELSSEQEQAIRKSLGALQREREVIEAAS
jgi:hypothetical protein